MIIMTVLEAPTGKTQETATAPWIGRVFQASSANGATMALARQLVAAGCPDQPWEARGPDHQRRCFGQQLHRLARLTVATDGRFELYRPFPRRGASPDAA
jgi:hypothetical protein